MVSWVPELDSHLAAEASFSCALVIKFRDLVVYFVTKGRF